MKKLVIILVVAILAGGAGVIGMNSKKIDSAIETGELEILIEKRFGNSGMPGPNGETRWGRSILFCNDGNIYLFEYDEYENVNYPYEENLKELTKELIENSEKMDKQLSGTEVENLQEYIDNILDGNENLKENEENNDKDELMLAEIRKSEYTEIFDYEKNEKIDIENCTSSSIKKIKKIIKKYN